MGFASINLAKTQIILISNLTGYTFCYNECESSHGGICFFISNNLNFNLPSDLLVSGPESLESSFIEITFPNKRNIPHGCLYKHPSMKTSHFNEKFLTPLLDKVFKGCLYHKTTFCHKVVLDVYLIHFFIRKIKFSFSRYLDSCAFQNL